MMNKVSHIVSFHLKGDYKNSFVSKSQRLFMDIGLTQFNNGLGVLMPTLVKSLKKLEILAHKKMKEISALEFMLPTLTQLEIFETSGRSNWPDLFKMNVLDKSYVLSPTCEEATAYLLHSFTRLPERLLPIKFYQINSKFRNEKRARSGLLRAKEFIMKDLYCFDTNEYSCEETYKEVLKVYHQFFNLLKVPYICVKGNSEEFGNVNSHEFHFLSEAGQDNIISCLNCGNYENMDLLKAENRDLLKAENKCSKCQSSNVTIKPGIEVGHTFNLGTSFTSLFNAYYIDKENKPKLLQMSSYGLGLSRILAASVEVLSKPDKIIWPLAIAPYLVCIIPPKAGSKEEAVSKNMFNSLYGSLNEALEDDIIVDDRLSLTIGKRIQLLEKLGIPFLVILGKNVTADPPTVEVVDSVTGSKDLVQVPDVTQFITQKLDNIHKEESQKQKITQQFSVLNQPFTCRQ